MTSIIFLSLQVSLTATLLATLIGLPIAAHIATHDFKGRYALITLLNTAMSLPPVVIGLLIYILLSNEGFLGDFKLLFTPTAMILAQIILTLPILISLSIKTLEPLARDYKDALQIDGAPVWRSLISMGRNALATVFLTAFGRAISEVGAIMIVGGNIRDHTRTMTTTIALETSKGDFKTALTLAIVLLSLSFSISAFTLYLNREKHS
jgi:tungstate transport system permease protein